MEKFLLLRIKLLKTGGDLQTATVIPGDFILEELDTRNNFV